MSAERTPQKIIGYDAYIQLVFEGYTIVRAEALASSQEEIERLTRALETIRDGRGKCRLCGKIAEGEGIGGYVSCGDRRGCTWEPQDPQEVAARALASKAGAA